MKSVFQRTIRTLGEENLEKLKTKTVAVFGTGGVGSYACEALVRAGVGNLIFIDKDVVDETNINRQLVADLTTVGRIKVEVMKERAMRVNPECNVQIKAERFESGDAEFIKNLHADFIVDAIDDVAAKISMAKICEDENIPHASSMGTGNRIHPELLQIADIYKTDICPLAKKIRKELRKQRVKKLTTIYSKEKPREIIGEGNAVGSISFVPPVAGMMLAGIAVRTFLEIE